MGLVEPALLQGNFGLSLKPILDDLHGEGLRSLGQLVSANSLLIGASMVVFWSGVLLVAQTRTFWEFAWLTIIGFVSFFWSFGLVFAMRRAALEARRKAAQTYSMHIEEAFRAFVRKPSPESLDKLEWLRQHQKVIRRLSSWPLTVGQTLILAVLSPLLILAVDALYIAIRMGMIPSPLSLLIPGSAP